MSSTELARHLEPVMRRLSIWVSGAAVVLMAGGFVWTMLSQHRANPTQAALPPSELIFPRNDIGLWTMSLGIFLLALLPTARVVLALILFVRSRQKWDVVVSLVVLLELLFSIWIGTRR